MQPNRIDSLLVNSAAVRVSERLAMLAAEEAHEEDFRYEPAALTLLLDELAQQNEFIVIDLPLYPANYRNKVLPMARDVDRADGSLVGGPARFDPHLHPGAEDGSLGTPDGGRLPPLLPRRRRDARRIREIARPQARQ